MQRRIVDALISIGIPANLKGFHYICDAIVLFDSDKYWMNGKITALYARIAAINGTTAVSYTHLLVYLPDLRTWVTVAFRTSLS